VLPTLSQKVSSKQVDSAQPGNAQPSFVKGEIYQRKRDIHLPYGGNHQSGISYSTKSSAVFIFTGKSGEQYGYHDKQDNLGVYSYTGEGQIGDMTLSKGNLAILNHAREGRALHIFASLGKGKGYRYLDEFCCESYRWGDGVDKRGNNRKTIVFRLVPVSANLLEEVTPDVDDDDQDPPEMSLSAARKTAFEAANTPEEGQNLVSRNVYARSKKVKRYVLLRADGACESCGKPAPFYKVDGAPYLEPHHVNRLSDGGLDHPNFVGGVCPTCHREIHYGKDGSKKNEELRIAIMTKENALAKSFQENKRPKKSAVPT
jgi:5-methylcytosine-specific restriction protein A